MRDVKVHLWDSLEEEMVRVHQLNNIIRYNTRNKINPESVASHSFFAAYFVLSICREYNIPDTIKLLALESAVVHDIPEVFINDITYDCKQLVPDIETLLKPYERSVLEQISPDSARILLGGALTVDEALAQAIVKWADVLSVKQYALSEVELGNQVFKRILDENEARLRMVEKEFKKIYQHYTDACVEYVQISFAEFSSDERK